MSDERITAAGKVFVAPRADLPAGRHGAEYGQVELLTNLEDGTAYIRVKGGYYAVDAEGEHSAVGQIADKDTLRRMGLALLSLSGFEIPQKAAAIYTHKLATWDALLEACKTALFHFGALDSPFIRQLRAAIEAAEKEQS